MKKQYIKPELMVEVLETIEMIATSNFDLHKEGGIEESLSNGRGNRRGTWGNLWYNED